VVDDDGGVVEHGRRPADLSHSTHPVLGRPFACVRGTFEYHCHPSHLNDRWDSYRPTIHLADLVDHLLRRADDDRADRRGGLRGGPDVLRDQGAVGCEGTAMIAAAADGLPNG
jgi:hypothetical protein